MALPLPIVLSLLVVQIGAMVVGFFGPPGGRVRPILTAVLFGAGIVLLALGLGAVVLGASQAGTLMVWSGVLLFASAARLLRGPERRGPDEEDDEEGGGGPGGPGDPPDEPGGPGLDWGRFDAERERWAAGRTPAGAR